MAFTVSDLDTAIQEILDTGQAVTHDGTTFKFPDLDKLYKMQRELTASSARATTRPLMRGFNFSTMGY